MNYRLYDEKYGIYYKSYETLEEAIKNAKIFNEAAKEVWDNTRLCVINEKENTIINVPIKGEKKILEKLERCYENKE